MVDAEGFKSPWNKWYWIKYNKAWNKKKIDCSWSEQQNMQTILQ